MTKFLIKAPRFLNGVYVHASPDFPAVIDIEIPEGRTPDRALFPLDEPKAKPHFAERFVEPPQTAAQRH
jgi:hypothetical protein